MTRPRGFTLIEMLIVVAIVAILATIAYPSYVGSVRKGRRADAIEMMTRIQQAQERWRANHSSYASDLSDLKVGATSNDYYDVTLLPVDEADSGTTYKISAAAKGTQEADTKCKVMGIVMIGGNLKYEPTSEPSCWSK